MKMLVACGVIAAISSAAFGQCRVWERVFPANSPNPRRLHAMAFDSRDDVLAGTVLFGGDENAPLGDTWVFNGTNWNLRATTGPSARAQHAMAYDSARERVVMFGGSDSSGVTLGDTWEWDGVSWSLVATTGPFRRTAHAMAYDSRRGRTVLFGGFTGNVAYWNDTWEWDGAAWTQVVIASPPEARQYHAMAYDSSCRRMIMFGGQGAGTGHLSDTWEYDGVDWMPSLPLASPSPRIGHSMVYDSVRRKTILIGGIFGLFQFTTGTWEYDGAEWELVSTGGASERAIGGAVFDSTRGKTVHFGGWDPTIAPTNQTWEWASIVAPVSITSQPANQIVNSLQTAVFSVSATGYGVLTYQWRLNGANISNGGGVTGADTPTLTLAGVGQASFGAYDCVVTNTCGAVTSSPAALRVHCLGDADNNGIVDFADVTAVFANWNMACP